MCRQGLWHPWKLQIAGAIFRVDDDMCQLLAYFDNPVQPFSLGYSWKYFWYRQNKNLDLKIISGKEKNSFFGYHSTK